MPKSRCDQLLNKTYYSTCYSARHRQAFWTYHALLKRSIQGKQKRTNNFRVDPELRFKSVMPNDFRGSGFDRGHMVPAADMKLNRQAMSESFLMTNISPQGASFNRGMWARLERTLRQLVLKYGDAYVATGAIFLPNPPKAVKDISMARYFYKVIFIPRQKRMFAFVMPHKSISSNRSVWEFAVTVNQVEQYSNVDFFASLPDDIEEAMESRPPMYLSR